MSDIIERLHGPDGMEAGQEILRLREENARLREALKSLAKHCNEMEAQNQDYHAMAEDGIPCLSQPLANAYAAIREGEHSE